MRGAFAPPWEAAKASESNRGIHQPDPISFRHAIGRLEKSHRA